MKTLRSLSDRDLFLKIRQIWQDEEEESGEIHPHADAELNEVALEHLLAAMILRDTKHGWERTECGDIHFWSLAYPEYVVRFHDGQPGSGGASLVHTPTDNGRHLSMRVTQDILRPLTYGDPIISQCGGRDPMRLQVLSDIHHLLPSDILDRSDDEALEVGE